MREYRKILLVAASLLVACSTSDDDFHYAPSAETQPPTGPEPEALASPNCKTSLPVGAVLLSGESLCQSAGSGILMNTGDNLLLMSAPARVWWSLKDQQKTPFVGKLTLIMQRDCNLVAYDAAGTAVWSSQSFGAGRDNCTAKIDSVTSPGKSGTQLALVIERDDSALPLKGSGESPVYRVWDSVNGVTVFDTENLSLDLAALKAGKSRFATGPSFSSCRPFDLNAAYPGAKIRRSDRKILLRSFTVLRSDRADGRFRYICLDLLDQDYGDVERHCLEYDRDPVPNGKLRKLADFELADLHNVDPNRPESWKWQTCSNRYNGVSLWNASPNWAKGLPDTGPQDYFRMLKWEKDRLTELKDVRTVDSAWAEDAASKFKQQQAQTACQMLESIANIAIDTMLDTLKNVIDDKVKGVDLSILHKEIRELVRLFPQIMLKAIQDGLKEMAKTKNGDVAASLPDMMETVCVESANAAVAARLEANKIKLDKETSAKAIGLVVIPICKELASRLSEAGAGSSKQIEMIGVKVQAMLSVAGKGKISTPGEALLFLSLGETVSADETCSEALARTTQLQKTIGDITKLWCPGGKSAVGKAALGSICKELGTIVAVGYQTIGTGLFSYFQNAEALESQGDLNNFLTARVTFAPRQAFNVYACYLAWKPGFQEKALVAPIQEERSDSCDAEVQDDDVVDETKAEMGSDADAESETKVGPDADTSISDAI